MKLTPAFLAILICGCEPPDVVDGKESEFACDERGALEVELFGGISTALNWHADVLACEGMPRPDGEGARLHFSGPIGKTADGITANAKTVAFILGLPDLEAGKTGSELPTNVTLIEEGSGRFFSTADMDGCWTDITRQEPIAGASGPDYRIDGTLYCVSPLPELNGSSSVNFTELKFSGRLNWKALE